MISNVVISASEYEILCNLSGVTREAEEREVVFCEECCYYCEGEVEGVCSLLSLFAEGGRGFFRVLPSDFCSWGEERRQ